MSSIVSRSKVLGLTVLALCGLTALMATSAQANWLENGVEIAVNKSVLAKAHTAGKMLIASLNFEIRCPTLDAEELKLIAGTTEATGNVKFLGCKGFQISNGAEQKNCTPETEAGVKETMIAKGTISLAKLAKIKGNAASLKRYFLFRIFGHGFVIKLPALCALAETSEVTGSLVDECGELNGSKEFVGEDCSVAQKVHLLQSAITTTYWKGTTHEEAAKDTLLFGENAAILDGIASVELESGNSWAGDA